jgi:hypothetical protein
MSVFGWLLRVIAIVFNVVLGLFLLGVGAMGWLTGEDLRFDLIPAVKGESLVRTLIGMGLFALLSVLLALSGGKLGSVLMLLWNLLVVSLLVYAGAWSSYRFDGMEHFQKGLLLLGAALLALWGSWIQLRRPRRPKDV